MKRLLDQGLAVKYLHAVFQAVIVTRILYALPAWRCFLSKELSGRIDAFLKRCYRYGFMSKIEHVDVLFDRVCMEWICFIKYAGLGCVFTTFCFL